MVSILEFSACNLKNLESESDLPELPYAFDLQAAISQVLTENPVMHPLGISAAVIVPGYKPWSGVAGYTYKAASSYIHSSSIDLMHSIELIDCSQCLFSEGIKFTNRLITCKPIDKLIKSRCL